MIFSSKLGNEIKEREDRLCKRSQLHHIAHHEHPQQIDLLGIVLSSLHEERNQLQASSQSKRHLAKLGS